ncbi:MAG: hypothetical protein ACRD4S_08430 [Candidatus Acidiferrales bacterium]
MLKRTFVVLAFVFTFALGLALQATPAWAQDQTYYTYVSEWAVPRAQWSAFEKARDQANSAMQHFVSDGTIVAWGSDDVYVHTAEGYTHADFFVATSRAGILKALDNLRPGATGGAYTSVTKHEDFFMHTLLHGGKTSSGATGYIRVTFWQAKPGEGEALVDVVKKYVQPVLDSEVADGTILMYNFDEQDIHTAAPGGYNLAIVYPNAEAMDTAYSRMMAGSKENPAVGRVISDLTVTEAHRDSLGKITAYGHK